MTQPFIVSYIKKNKTGIISRNVKFSIKRTPQKDQKQYVIFSFLTVVLSLFY